MISFKDKLPALFLFLGMTLIYLGVQPPTATVIEIEIEQPVQPLAADVFEELISPLKKAVVTPVKQIKKTASRTSPAKVKNQINFARAIRHEELGQLELASESYQKACFKDENGEACVQHINIQIELGQATESDLMEYYTLACDVKNSKGCLQLAELYRQQGHGNFYDQYYKMACQLDPERRFQNCPQYGSL